MNKQEHTTNSDACESARMGRLFAHAVDCYNALDADPDRRKRDDSELTAAAMQIEGIQMATLGCKISSPLGALHAIAQVRGCVSYVQGLTSDEAALKHCDAIIVSLDHSRKWIETCFSIDGEKEVRADYCSRSR